MRTSVLLSKAWCDLVFEGRNKAYGAYRLRAQAGWRCRVALGLVAGVILFFIILFLGLALYGRYRLQREIEKAEDIFARRPADLKEGYDVKFMATARLAPPKRMAPGAKSSVPEIVDGLPPMEVIGADGPIDYDPQDQIITTPIVDTTHISDEDMPVAKQKIVPTEQISQMPEFPGGLRAFMRWLDENIRYPQAAIRRKSEGVLTITFVVDEEGYPTDIQIKNSFDTQILRMVKNVLSRMPRWKPGTDEQGSPAPVKVTVPVEFKVG